jgi:hypothetical protein
MTRPHELARSISYRRRSRSARSEVRALALGDIRLARSQFLSRIAQMTVIGDEKVRRAPPVCRCAIVPLDDSRPEDLRERRREGVPRRAGRHVVHADLSDFNFALPTAEITVMGTSGVVKILIRREIADAPIPTQGRTWARSTRTTWPTRSLRPAGLYRRCDERTRNLPGGVPPPWTRWGTNASNARKESTGTYRCKGKPARARHRSASNRLNRQPHSWETTCPFSPIS